MTVSDIYILGVITGAIAIYWLLIKVNSWRRRKTVKRAKKGEREAANFLEKEGYKIDAVQKSTTFFTEVDGKSQKNMITADYLVSKGGRKYIVEVKTGKQTARITASRIRRQLLEYFLIFRPHGIILLDMDNKKLKHIFFKTSSLPLSLKGRLPGILGYLLVLLTGVIMGVLYQTIR